MGTYPVGLHELACTPHPTNSNPNPNSLPITINFVSVGYSVTKMPRFHYNCVFAKYYVQYYICIMYYNNYTILYVYYFYYLQVQAKKSTLKVLEGPKVMMVERRNFTVRYMWRITNVN